MMRFQRGSLSWRGFTPQLFALVVLPLSVLTIIIAFGGLSLHRQAMRTVIGERDERAARAAASAVSQQLDHRTKSIHGMALFAGSGLTAENARSILNESDYLLADFDLGLAFFQRGGDITAAIGEAGFWESLNPTPASLEAALQRDAPPPLLVLSDPTTGEPVILVLAVAVKGGPIAVGAFDPAGLARQALAGIFVSDPGSVVFLVDSDGQILYQSGTLTASETPETHPGIQEALSGNSGTNFVPFPGGEHVVSFSPITPAGWALVIEEPWEALTPPLLRTTEYAPFVLIPAFLVVLVALWFGVRQIVQPLQALESQAAELGRGQYEAIEKPVGGIAEIRHLQEELIELAHKVKTSQSGLRGYIGAITTGQEEERLRLARELHDDTLQSLIALNQRIQLTALAAGDTKMAASLEEVQQLTEQTIRDLRRITRALRPIYLEDLGLVAALEMLARETGTFSQIPVRFQLSGEPRRLNPQAELAFFRMAQEALNNTVRHAEAGRVSLEIVFNSEGVILHVMDDGKGFIPPETPADLAPQGHFGLLGLHERADLIGAKLEILSSNEEGTHILISYADLQIRRL